MSRAMNDGSLAIGFATVFLIMAVMSQTAQANPLFENDAPIRIRIEAPFGDLIRSAPRSTDPYPARLVAMDEEGRAYDIKLSARGKSRRRKDVCAFPPLRVAFADRPDGGLFAGQKRLKLVTHCRRAERHQQYALLEYAAYRLFNAMTPHSLRVRLAEIDYVESGSGKTIVSRKGFFIEDADDAAERNGLKEIDAPAASLDQMRIESAARYALFQYMIGNLDWSMLDGPPGDDCCHNTKLIGPKGAPAGTLIPVPYDFDHAGLIDAPYAAPPANLRVRSVRQRVFRGFCEHNDLVKAEAERLLSLRAEFASTALDIPGLEPRNRTRAQSYVDDFFAVLEKPSAFEKKVLKACR